MKKVALGITCFLLSACSSEIRTVQPAFPGEFANLDYELSDSDAKRWVVASKQAEQCIYPNLTRIQQNHFSQEDAYIHSQYVFFYPLEEIIGAEYVKMVQQDEKSMGYAQYQFKRFKQANVEPMNKETCQILREQARTDLAVVKGQYTSGMVEPEQNASPKKDEKGAATDQNKFFFDIIKWGAALLL